jgi:hypothetical protein
MEFVYHGTLQELTDTIHDTAKKCGKDLVVYDEEPGILKIGFQRLGHHGGRFFVANITETDTGVILQGEFADIYSDKRESHAQRFFSLLGGFAMVYILMELVLQSIWLPVFHFSHIWIPFLLPIPVLICLRINAIKEEKQMDANFIGFMSTLTAKYCPYLNEYLDKGCCYDLQMICDGYIKDSALPEIKIDKTELSKQCQNCKLR